MEHLGAETPSMPYFLSPCALTWDLLTQEKEARFCDLHKGTVWTGRPQVTPTLQEVRAAPGRGKAKTLSRCQGF